ncbi:unnamed protein product [Closterium sp. Yama58-4]|nr:unnamed protein product [Closterium sp. Yama58-4]
MLFTPSLSSCASPSAPLTPSNSLHASLSLSNLLALKSSHPVPLTPCLSLRASHPVPLTPCLSPRASHPVPLTPCLSPRASHPVPLTPCLFLSPHSEPGSGPRASHAPARGATRRGRVRPLTAQPARPALYHAPPSPLFTAVNLAVALSRHMRLQVGLLDGDIFGPSLPSLLGLATAGRPQLASAAPNARMLPLQAHGMLCMSMGFLMPADVAAVWRGPMVMAAVEKLVRGTEWGRLDVLVVDMPPGTGDVQLSMSQRVRLSGARPPPTLHYSSRPSHLPGTGDVQLSMSRRVRLSALLEKAVQVCGSGEAELGLCARHATLPAHAPSTAGGFHTPRLFQSSLPSHLSHPLTIHCSARPLHQDQSTLSLSHSSTHPPSHSPIPPPVHPSPLPLFHSSTHPPVPPTRGSGGVNTAGPRTDGCAEGSDHVMGWWVMGWWVMGWWVMGWWGDGMVGDGMVGDGMVGAGVVGDGMVGAGVVGDGLVGDGVVGDGVVGDGVVGW